ncbi:tryptophan synthase subunit beta [Coraliomargarita akajimensis]|uniref:Tryptophan synthase beta chain n=1 Tax=Coraliomargarita akajimensis (strain DSM 45221 / IAM 15411 / JCM 23193 / KCTC 12865 / 04OKA010-24) TaxID=583355 RepID=D5EQT1_CORAD|nr:tryptophan synthase subunit beta [Coraliomargarita akajimensis]ADE53924.1 tryptophan synthase, beta subunit [Coraliomargarita akajimensis DSM 45221]
MADYSNYTKQHPDSKGYFGAYGGAYLPPELETAFAEITAAYDRISSSHAFISELRRIRKHYQGRPTPVGHAANLSTAIGTGCQIYLKREDLNHSGAHKLNHCMAEALLAKEMGKRKLIAETGAGQHGVALATAAAYFGLECEIHMGEVDIAKEAPNVTRMKLLGCTVVPVSHGLKTLKEAVDSAFEAYLKDPVNSIYCIGSVVGPHPFPAMVRDFQSIVGAEAREQFSEITGTLPDSVMACVGGGSNAIGMFTPFLNDPVELIGIEPGGKGTKLGEHAATMSHGSTGIIHGFKCYLLQDETGEPAPVHSIASGLDYPGVGPEHSFLKDQERVRYEAASDDECLEAFYLLSRTEGIIPALESSHAIAGAIREAKARTGGTILVNLSGRGDKDLDFVTENFGYGEAYLKDWPELC